MLNVYYFDGFNILYILIVVWVLVFLFQHIKFEKIKVKKQVLAVNKKKEIFVNIVRNHETKSINVKDVKNKDKLELNDGEILRFDGVIKSGIGML